MKLKRGIALGLAVIMMASMLTACGSTEKQEETSPSTKQEVSQEAPKENAEASSNAATEEPAKESEKITFPLAEPVTFTVMGLTTAVECPLEQNPVLVHYLEKANVQFDYELQVIRSEAAEKGNLMLAGGDYPEILYKMAVLDANQLGMDGTLIPLEDLIREHMPNLCAVMDERNAWAKITAADGHIYTLPQCEQKSIYGLSDSQALIQEQWIENLGLEMPNSMESLYTVLKAFKEQDANKNGDVNDEIPFSTVENQYWALLPYIGDGLHYIYDHVTIKDDALVFYPSTEGFKEFVAWLAKLYQEGIWDQDSFTQTSDQIGAKGKSGDIIGMNIVSSGAARALPEYAPCYALLPPFSDTPMPLDPGVYPGAVMITDKCENPEVALAFFDQFYTEEAGMEVFAGLEGHGWKDNGDGTYTSYASNFTNQGQYKMAGLAATPMLLPAFYYTGSTDPTRVKTYEKFGEDGFITNGQLLPILSFTEEETERLSIIKTDIVKEVDSYVADVATGVKTLDGSWEEFQNTLQGMGAEEYLSIYQAAYERATAK